MSISAVLGELCRVDEPQAIHAYADVLTRVAADHRPVVVRRNGADLAAVIPMDHLDLLREVFERQEAEKLAAKIKWPAAAKLPRPPQSWFDETDNPCEPAAEPES